uniref:Uncharacterized protein n=1 Tax=Trichogramma kaykai TaxID=54128 RepID=A0ABD2XGT0_9HYME
MTGYPFSSCCYCTVHIWCRYARQRRDRRLRRRCGCLNYAWTWLTYNVYCLLDDECVQILFYKPSAGNFLYKSFEQPSHLTTRPVEQGFSPVTFSFRLYFNYSRSYRLV